MDKRHRGAILRERLVMLQLSAVSLDPYSLSLSLIHTHTHTPSMVHWLTHAHTHTHTVPSIKARLKSQQHAHTHVRTHMHTHTPKQSDLYFQVTHANRQLTIQTLPTYTNTCGVLARMYACTHTHPDKGPCIGENVLVIADLHRRERWQKIQGLVFCFKGDIFYGQYKSMNHIHKNKSADRH